jgi:transposase InsO family protein
VRLILEDADAHGWGARKVLKRLSKRHPELELPARSTVFDILERHGRVKHKQRRRHYQHPGSVPIETTAPNDVWTADFKGQFRTRNGVYCYPLTVVDHHIRFLPPFASTGIHGLTALNVWWMQLGIVHQRIEPGCPQQSGAHERMHRTLKARTTRPPSANLNKQQLAFNRFRRDYNEERPHESLGDEVPASMCRPSPRPYPSRILPPEYPGHRVDERSTKITGARGSQEMV